MGSRRKREGIGPTESASKPRRRGRSGWRTSSRSAEAARRGKRHQGRGESLTRSLALPRRSSTQRRCPAAPSGRPACASRRHCRRRRPLPPLPLSRHHVRRCRPRRRQRLPAASGSNPSANHRRAPESSRSRPRPSWPRPALVLHPSVPSCAAELGQCKVISGRGRARLLSGRAVARPPLAQHPPGLTLSGRPELVLSSCPHLFCIPTGTVARESRSARLDSRCQIYARDRS